MLPNYIENSKSFEMLTRDMRLRLGETSPMKPKPYQHDNPITYMLSSSSGEDAKGQESEEEEEEANATEIDDEEKNSDCVQTPKNPNHPDNVETQIMVFGSGHSGYWSLDSKEESQLEVLKEGPFQRYQGRGLLDHASPAQVRIQTGNANMRKFVKEGPLLKQSSKTGWG